MPPELASPIAGRSHRCLHLFDRLSHLDANALDYTISPAACLDESGRFRLWANNIGALLSGDHRNSLDFRLREASKICSRIVEFLDDLAEALDDACSIVSGTRPYRCAIISNSLSSVGSEISEISEVFGTIKDSITSLMQTSIIIRNATPRDRYIKAQSSTKNPFLESFDIAHVGHKFPKVDSESREWLKKRLGKAITQRRQYLKYCRQHHDKFSRKVEDVDLSSESKDPFYDLGSIMRSENEAGTVRSVPTSALATTVASTLQPSKLEVSGGVAESDAENLSDSYSQTSYATSVHENMSESRLHTPLLKDITNVSPFECPYCWTIQEISSEKSWRKHVFTDLRPYVCTFEKCDLRLFADRHTWFNHELECHRSEWCCRFCSNLSFGSEPSLSTHMRHRHPQFSSPIQLPALIEASRQPTDRISAAACPLCHWDVTLRDINTSTPSNGTLVVTIGQFRHHLASHMEQLALFALPRSFKGEEEDVDSNEAAALTKSDSQSRDILTETMSWKTASSRGATVDKFVPDVSTSIAPIPDVRLSHSYPWSQHRLAGNDIPFPRYGGATSQTCTKAGNMYIQGGGRDGEPEKGDTWVIDTEKMSVYRLETALEGPGPRSRHAALLVGNAFIVFGDTTTSAGNSSILWGSTTTSAGKESLDNLLYMLDIGTRNWSRAQIAKSPSVRSHPTLSILGPRLLVFGGRTEGSSSTDNDLYAFDLNTLQSHPSERSWEVLTSNEPYRESPHARESHTMVSWDGKLYLFGGTDRESSFSDVWEYSLPNGWRQIECSGNIPQPRHSHAAAVVDGIMYVFGGRSQEGRDLGDLAGFKIVSSHWYTFQDMGPSPSPRRGHRMCVHDKKIFVVGGCPTECPFRFLNNEVREELALIYTLDTSKIRFPDIE